MVEWSWSASRTLGLSSLQVHPSIINYFQLDWAKDTKKITGKNVADSVVIKGFTECRYGGHTYRCHPNLNNSGAEWYDWASVQFDVDGAEPATFVSKLLCFYQIEEEDPDADGRVKNHVLVHSCRTLVEEPHSTLTEKWTREYRLTRRGTCL